jgi:hypothetical protein
MPVPRNEIYTYFSTPKNSKHLRIFALLYPSLCLAADQAGSVPKNHRRSIWINQINAGQPALGHYYARSSIMLKK